MTIDYGDGVTYISTHTLTWSVTLSQRFTSISFSISTHTLTWSVTSTSLLWHFSIVISTHTLTWSVTLTDYNNIIHPSFQLTRSRGA